MERHTTECVDCRAELYVLRELSVEVPHAFAGASPSPRLKQRLMAAIGTEREAAAPAARRSRAEEVVPGIFVNRDAGRAWRRTPFTGVEFQMLYMDPQTRMATSLLKIEPGCQYPAHHHVGVEQSFVVEDRAGSARFICVRASLLMPWRKPITTCWNPMKAAFC